jgi:hypothetical protein
MQWQGQNMLRNWLRRAVSRRTKRHIKVIMEKKKILMKYQRYVQNWTKVDGQEVRKFNEKYLYTSPSETLLVNSRNLADITP